MFRSLSRENLLWKCSREREQNISILTILHLSFYFPVHRVNKSICAPIFTSSDWSSHVFVIRTSQTWCNMPQKFTPVKVKQTQKVGGTNWLINTLSMTLLKLLFAIRLLPDMLFLNTSHIFFKHFQHSGRTTATLRNKFLWLQTEWLTPVLGIVSVRSKSVKYFNF